MSNPNRVNPPNPGARKPGSRPKEPEPFSRFWACFFAATFPVVGFYWTLKMKTATLWILPLIPLSISFWAHRTFTEYYTHESSYLTEIIHITIDILLIITLVYLMFKWTTKYNLDNFGYKSKKEWKIFQSS